MSGQMVLPHVIIVNNMSEQNKYFLVLYPNEKPQVLIAGLNKMIFYSLPKYRANFFFCKSIIVISGRRF
jgi:hypothetical protein